MRINKFQGNDCGGFKSPKGHLDTQLFPECEGTETDRDIVKKNREKKTKVTARHDYPIIKNKPSQPVGIWEQWKNGKIDDKKFVELMKEITNMDFHGVSKDPAVRRGILKAIESFNKNRDYPEAARAIGSFLSMGHGTSESFFASSGGWYKRAVQEFPELRGDLTPSQKPWMNPTKRELIIEKFKEKHPNVTKTLKEMWEWYRENFTDIPSPMYSQEEHLKRDKKRDYS